MARNLTMSCPESKGVMGVAEAKNPLSWISKSDFAGREGRGNPFSPARGRRAPSKRLAL